MKILFIITRADTVGGVQVHVRDMAKSLIEQGHKILVVTGTEGIYNQNLKDYGVDFISCSTFYKEISPLKDWQTFRFLKQVVKDFQPELICAHSSKAGIFGRLVGKTDDIPCIFTAHGWAFTDGVPQPKRSIYKAIEQLTEPLADKIICVSEHDRSIGIKSGMNSDRLLTIHNGMPDIPQELRANPHNSDSVKIAMVARFDKQKDHMTLLKAFQNLNGGELILIGDGPDLEEIKTYVNQTKISSRVRFVGFCHNVKEILAEVQIFTLISNWEGLPITIIEAMRAGLPVVASDVGGVNEMVIDGVTGFCIPRGDEQCLEEKLKSLIEDDELRQKMGNSAREKYESEFTFEAMSQKNVRLYQQVVAARSRSI